MNEATADRMVSVLMPTYRQSHMLLRALQSVFAQTYQNLEVIVALDGADDRARGVLEQVDDDRLTVLGWAHNRGLGAALNAAISTARGRYVAVLPSDDVWYPGHLASAMRCFTGEDTPGLVYGGLWSNRVREGWSGLTLKGDAYVGNEHAGLVGVMDLDGVFGRHAGNLLKLVQVTVDRRACRDLSWTEREQFVSDDIEGDLWRRLADEGVKFACTGEVTCEWTDHPDQRHKIIGERPASQTADFTSHWAHSGRGLSAYRAYYQVPNGQALDWRPTNGPAIREQIRYGAPTAASTHAQAPSKATTRGMRILLVGDLGFNPDRLLALEAAGHELYALWAPHLEPWDHGSSMPVGNVQTIERDRNWHEQVRDLKPDVVYALLNFRALPLISEFVQSDLDIPVAFHFKESPFEALRWGMWPMLTEVLERSAGHIHISDVARQWFALNAPTVVEGKRALVLDGDLPRARWMDDRWTPKLSTEDGLVHTVCVGRPLGLESMSGILSHDVVLHLYWSPQNNDRKNRWLREMSEFVDSGRIRLHPHVDPVDWVHELSRFDAAWVHSMPPGGTVRDRSLGWDYLNLPARLGTYAAAGLPWIIRGMGARGSSVESVAHRWGVDLSAATDHELINTLADRGSVRTATENMVSSRAEFAFDTHVDRLVEFLRQLT